MSEDRELTLADIIEYNQHRPFEERKALLYGMGSTFQVRTLADELPSILVAGLPGFGKTSAVAFLCCQIVMCLGKLVLIDPHCFAPRDSLAKIVAPLSDYFALPLIDFEDSRQVVQAFEFVLGEYERRNRKGASNFYPLFLIVDEWNLLLDLLDDDELETVILAVRTIARSARKFGIWLCLIAQNWNLDSSGGPEVRKSITGRISFAQELSDMRMTLNTRDNHSLADLTSTPLGKGHAIFKHPSYGMKRVWFPQMDRSECAIVAQNMRQVFGHSAPDSAESAFDMPELPRLPQPERKSALNQPDKPIGSMIMQPDNGKNRPENSLKVPDNEYKKLIQEGNKLIAETGRVVRGDLKKILGWNSYQYEHWLKPVCDQLGWDHKMNGKKELYTQEKQELREATRKCAMCGSTENLEVDHVWPRAKGGPSTPDNLQILCKVCNSKKGIISHA